MCGLSLLAGAITSLGRPGLEWVAVALPATVAWLSLVLRAPRVADASLAGLCHGAALFATICIGSISWGYEVFATFVAYGTLGYSLPLALWTHWASRRLSPRMAFAGTAALFALIMDAADWLYAPKVEVLALVRLAPWWLGGARLVGANVLEGLLVAGQVVAAFGLQDGGSRARRAWEALRPLAGSAAALALLSLTARASAAPSTRTLSAGIVQLNVPEHYYRARMGSPSATARLRERIRTQLAALTNTELLVFTESYEERYGLLFSAIRRDFAARSASLGQAILASSYLVDARGDRSNAVALFSGGVLRGVHEKVDLAPFGEDEVSPGADYRPLPIDRDLSVGVMICNEAVLPRASRELVERGAGVFAVSTDDASFNDSVVVFEHLANAQVRSIEVGRDTVWASNRGPSGSIDRFGSFRATTVMGAAQPSSVQLASYVDLTPFVRTRWLWIALELLVLANAIVAARRTRQRRSFDVTTTGPALRPLVAGVCTAGLVTVLSPALVRSRHGNQTTAWSAIAETLTPRFPLGERGAYARFTTNPNDTLRGALAYLLSYYGPDIGVTELPSPLPQPNAASIQRYLEDHFGVESRVVALGERAPTAAALVQRRDGKYAVIAASKGPTFFFFPENGASGTVPFASLLPSLTPSALVLAQDRGLMAH